MEYGIQMFGMRHYAEEHGLEAALKAVADIGYKYIEFFDFYGHTAEEVKDFLDKYNLTCIASHTPWDDLVKDFEGTVKFHKTIGNKNYVLPWIEVHNTEKIQILIDYCKEYIPKLAAEGMTMHYHNHTTELKLWPGAIFPLAVLENQTDIRLETDVYWLHVAKTNPVKVLERLHDRIDLIHVRDGVFYYDESGCHSESRPLGQGTTPLAEIVATAKKYNMMMIVESSTDSIDDVEEAKIGFDYLKSLE